MRSPAPSSTRFAVVLAGAALAAGCGTTLGDDDGSEDVRPATTEQQIAAAPPHGPSRAMGKPSKGRLVGGLQLPEQGPDHVTWDPIRHVIPNRPGRRWATDRLLVVLLDVIQRFRAAHPGDAPRVLVGDLSRPNGGTFGPEFGGLGHASHQNGLDADVYYPRLDRSEQAARMPSQVDRARAQELVDELVAARVQFAFVGTKVRPTGPKEIVQAIPHHNDHVHIRIR